MENKQIYKYTLLIRRTQFQEVIVYSPGHISIQEQAFAIAEKTNAWTDTTYGVSSLLRADEVFSTITMTPTPIEEVIQTDMNPDEVQAWKSLMVGGGSG